MKAHAPSPEALAAADDRGLVARVLKPTPYHRSRLHTLRGTTMAPREWLDLPVQLGRRLAAREPRGPWVSLSAIRELERILTPESRMVEVGAGYSTPWLAQRVGELTSFEADGEWLDRVREMLETAGLPNVTLKSGSYAEIGGAVRALEDGAYDVFFVDAGDDLADGPGRVEFVEMGKAKVKPGGYVVLDNSDWPFYAAVDDLLEGWEAGRFKGPPVHPLTVTETSFYRRPELGSDHRDRRRGGA